MKKLLAKIRRILRDRRTRRFLTRFVSGIAAIVVFVTTYALVLPAITMESEALCGIEAHQHDDSCYSENLICGQEESEGHHHIEDCYTVTRELVCQLQEHRHSAENNCFDEEGNLVCALEEHTHADSCYEEHRELTCGLEETEGHQHTDSCYEKVLTCGKEVHTHSADCYRADLEIQSAAVASTGTTSASAAAFPDEEYFTEDSQNEGPGSEGWEEAVQDVEEDETADEAAAEENSVISNDSDDEGRIEEEDTASDIGSAEADNDFAAENGDANTGNDSIAAEDDDASADNDSIAAENDEADIDHDGIAAEDDDTDTDNNGIVSEDDDAGKDNSNETADTDNTDAEDPADNINEDTEKDTNTDKGEEDAASSFSTGFAADENEENGDAYIPEKEELYFNTVINRRTGIYYHHVAEDESIEDSSAITGWARADEDTRLNPEDVIRIYLSYTLPKDTINATNDIARYRLPDTLHLTDDQIDAINSCENGISGQYMDFDTLEITDPERHAACLGLESVEGSRCPDEELKEDSQEFISATV
ncbi:MAG: hypothetical protein Q4D71_09930, partial [Oscillospiraceae bacterium]|nr:hypothetical protein [Oscillospiraceae bacterium]